MIFFQSYIKTLLIFSALFILIGCGDNSTTLKTDSKPTKSPQIKKKVLYVDSYHRGYEWSDGITSGVLSIFNAKLNDDDTVNCINSNVELRIARMDTKRNKNEDFKIQAGLKVKKIIEEWKPDVVIASDDNATIYLIVPYFKNKKLPFVFCGINGNAHKYGYPFSNVTGMVEVLLINQIVDTLKMFSKGTRLALLTGNVTTDRNNAMYFKEALNRDIDVCYVDDFEEWKKEFIKLQTESDMLLIANGYSIKNWDKQAAKKLVYENIKVPIGGWDVWNVDMRLATYAQDATEQGSWAAKAANDILNGKKVTDIKIVVNKKASIHLNMLLAKKLGVKFPIELIENAHIYGVEESEK